MSERLKSKGPTNDEVINEITQDLKSSLRTSESIEEFVINPGTSAEDFPKAGGDAPHTNGMLFFYQITILGVVF